MWKRIISKSNDAGENPPSQSSRRKENEQRPTRKLSKSIPSTATTQKPSRGDDCDQGFYPTSTSYFSTTPSSYPAATSASIVSNYATASGDQFGESYSPPGLPRDANLANQMPNSKLGRGERDSVDDQEHKSERRRERSMSPGRKRDKKQRRGIQEKDAKKLDRREKKGNKKEDAHGIGEVMDGYGASIEMRRGDFTSQIGEPGFMQFPGQNGAGFVGGPPPVSASTSAHVQDQFPNQFPIGIAEPYRPPLAINEGGPGLAADYYGDTGESVATQPGIRPQQPSLIIGAEPHLQPASSTVAPPVEPSSVGHVGAAASFFDGSFESEANQPSYQQSTANPNAPSSSMIPNRPENNHTSSVSVRPTIGAAAAAAAGGSYMANHSNHYNERPEHDSVVLESQPSTSYRPQVYAHSSHSSTAYHSTPLKPGQQSTSASNLPLYAAGPMGMGVAAYYHDHPSHSQRPPSSQVYVNGSMALGHRKRGPLATFVDFLKDPEGVAQFEEYTEYIGVCKNCFAPGSTPRDAPRKHHFRSRRSGDRFGSSTRIDKDNRYSSSDSEKRRRKRKSWLEAGVAGYGLSKVGESLFNQKHDFDDTYSVKSGHLKKSHTASSPDRKSYTSRGTTQNSHKTVSNHRDSSKDPDERSVTSNVQLYEKGAHARASTSFVVGKRDIRHRSKSRSRSRSKDRKIVIDKAAIGAAMESSTRASNSRQHDPTIQKAFVRRKHSHPKGSRERQQAGQKKEKKRKKKGFFTFSSSSSSSFSEDLVFDARTEKSNSRRRRNSKEDHRKAQLAVAGLGAAAAALALNETREANKLGRRHDVVAVKESKQRTGWGSGHRRAKKQSAFPVSSLEEDPWESAPDEGDDINSDLAFGGSVRRSDSRSSLSSQSSGTSKWGWRWGSKRRTRKPGSRGRHDSPDDHHPGITMHSNSSLPLRRVDPLPTSNPSRFETGSHGFSNGPSYPKKTARPEPVPIQHPQPVTPVSSAVYSAQIPYDHAYSAPTGPPVFSRPPYQSSPPAAVSHKNAKDDSSSFQVPGQFPEAIVPSKVSFDGATNGATSRRRDSLPSAGRRLDSLENTSSAVRFDLIEEQIKKDRRDKRRQAKEEDERRTRRERHRLEDQEELDRPTQPVEERTRRGSLSRMHAESMERKHVLKDGRSSTGSSEDRSLWTSLVAAAGITSIVGAAVEAQKSGSERSDVEENERFDRRRRRRGEREAAVKDTEETTIQTTRGRQSSGQVPETSVWKDLAKIKRSSSHEDYKDFFVPHELLSKAPGYKEAVAEADADQAITAFEGPNIITIEPTGFYESREAPAYAFGPDGEELNPHPKSPSWVPKLKLIAPTPQPSSLIGSEKGNISPIEQPQDMLEDIIGDIPRPISAYEVEVDDQETPEYTIIEPKERRGDNGQSLPSEALKGESTATMLEDEIRSRDVPALNQADTVYSFSDDLVFAATLAAGLEEVGLDPSIVVDDPSFRRRDSPPGSGEPGTYHRPFAQSIQVLGSDVQKNEVDVPPQQGFVEGELPESSMPGAFVEEESLEQPGEPEPRIGKKERKRRDKKAKRSKVDDTSGEQSHNGNENHPDGLHGQPEPIVLASEASVRDLQPSLKAVSSNAASAPSYRDVTKGEDLEKKSKQSSQGYDDEGLLLLASTGRDKVDGITKLTQEECQSNPIGLSGRSDEDVAESRTAEEGPDTGRFDIINDGKKRNKKSKGRKSAREVDVVSSPDVIQGPDNDAVVKEYKSKKNGEKRRSGDGGSLTDLGRITQDLPAKVSTPAPIGRAPSSPTDDWLTNPEDRSDTLDLDAEPETTDRRPPVAPTDRDHSNDVQAQAFLGMRQEIPPSPDIPAFIEPPPLDEPDRHSSSPVATEPNLVHRTPTGAVSLPTSPTRRPGGQAQRLSELQNAGGNQSPHSSPSTTAIPVHFRIPPASPGVARSSPSAPQTPSAQDAQPSRPKLRPRSTEFKSSNEFRPLWLVERHGSKQESTLDETYPSLPSSHTTSRTSSVRDHAETGSDSTEFFNSIEYQGEVNYAGDGLMIDTIRATTETGLLDSQQTTPTAATFPDAPSQKEEAAQPAAAPQSEPPPLQHRSKAGRIDEVVERSGRPSPPDQPVAPERNLPSLKDITLGAVLGVSSAGALFAATHEENKGAVQTDGLKGDENPPMEEKPETAIEQSSSHDIDGFMASSVDHAIEERSGHDLAPDLSSSMNGKLGSQAQEPVGSARPTEVEYLTMAQQRAIQEQDAQDAVDSWFSSPSPKMSKTDRKGKRKSRSVVTQNQSKTAWPAKASTAPQHVDENDVTMEEAAFRQAIDESHQREKSVVPISESRESVTREMPAEEVIAVMSGLAAVANQDESPSVEARDPAIVEQECSATTTETKAPSGQEMKAIPVGPQPNTSSNLAAAKGLDQTSADPIIKEPLEYNIEQESSTPIDTYTQNVGKDPSGPPAADLGLSNAPLERVDESQNYASPTRKGKRGKRKSKQVNQSQDESDIAPEAISSPSGGGLKSQDVSVENVHEDTQLRDGTGLDTNFATGNEIEGGWDDHGNSPMEKPSKASNFAPALQDLQWPAQGHSAEVEFAMAEAQALALASHPENLILPEDVPLPTEKIQELLDLRETDRVERNVPKNNDSTVNERPSADHHEGYALNELPATITSYNEPRSSIVEPELTTTSPPLQGDVDLGISSLPRSVQPDVSESRDADDFHAVPAKKGKKGKKGKRSKQSQPAEIDVVATQDETERDPLTPVLQPADHGAKQEPESLSMDQSANGKSNSAENQQGKGEARYTHERLKTSQDMGARPGNANFETSDPPPQRTEAATDLPSEIELPRSDFQGDNTDNQNSEPMPSHPEIPLDYAGSPSPVLLQVSAEPIEPAVLTADEVERPGIKNIRLVDGLVSETREPQHYAFPPPVSTSSVSDTRQYPAYPNTTSTEAPVVTSEDLVAHNGIAHDGDMGDLNPDMKSAELENNLSEGLPEIQSPARVEETNALAAPIATTNVAEAVKDMIGSSNIDESEKRTTLDFGSPRQEVASNELTPPLVPERPLENDEEWEEGYNNRPRKRSKSRITKKGDNQDLEDLEDHQPFSTSEDRSHLTTPRAMTDTAQEIQDMLQFTEKEAPPAAPEQDVNVAPVLEATPLAEKASQEDQAEWNVSKEKGKRKKAKEGRKIMPEDADSSQVLEPSGVPSNERMEGVKEPWDEPLQELNTNKPKGPKKSKRRQSVPIATQLLETAASGATNDSLGHELTEGRVGPTLEIESPISQDDATSPIAGAVAQAPQPDRFAERLALPTVAPLSTSENDIAFDKELKSISRPTENSEDGHDGVQNEHSLALPEGPVQATAYDLNIPKTIKTFPDVFQQYRFLEEKKIDVEQEPLIEVPSNKIDKEQMAMAEDFRPENGVLQPPVGLRTSENQTDDNGGRAEGASTVGEERELYSGTDAATKDSREIWAIERDHGKIPSLPGAQSPQDTFDLQQEPSSEPIDIVSAAPAKTTEATIESNPMGKKSKKRGKKTSVAPWDEDATPPIPQFETAVLSNAGVENDAIPAQDLTQDPAQLSVEEYATVPKSKKDRKKAKKAKRLGSQENADMALPDESNDAGQMQESSQEPGISVADDFKDGPRGRKGQKKIRKEQFPMNQNDLPEALLEEEASFESKAWQPELEPTVTKDPQIQPEKLAKEPTESFTSSSGETTNGNELSRKLRSSSSTDNPKVSKAGSSLHPESLGKSKDLGESVPVPETLKDASIAPAKAVEAEFGSVPMSKKERKKAKKSRALARAEEPDVFVPERDGGFEANILEDSDTATPNMPPQTEPKAPATTNKVAESFESVPKSKKERKKATKLKILPGEGGHNSENLRIDDAIAPEDDFIAHGADALNPSIGDDLDATAPETGVQTKSEELNPLPADTVGVALESAPKGKKEKKKGKKFKPVSPPHDSETGNFRVDDGATPGSKGGDVSALQASPEEGLTKPGIEPIIETRIGTGSAPQSKKAKTKSDKTKYSALSDDLEYVSDRSTQEIVPDAQGEGVTRPDTDLEQPHPSHAPQHPSGAADEFPDNAEVVQQVDLDPEQPATGIELPGRSALVTGEFSNAADPSDQPATGSQQPLPEETARELSVAELEHHPFCSPTLLQSATEPEYEGIIEKQEIPPDTPHVTEPPAEGYQSTSEQTKRKSALPFEGTELESKPFDEAMSSRAPLTQGVFEGIAPAEEIAEHPLPSNVLPHISALEKHICKPLPSEPQLHLLPQFEDEEGRQQERIIKGPSQEDETTHGESPSISFEGQYNSEAPLATEQVVEGPLPSSSLTGDLGYEAKATAGIEDQEPDRAPPYHVKRTKKDKKMAKKAKVLDIEEEIAQSAPRVISDFTVEPPPAENLPRVEPSTIDQTSGLNGRAALEIPSKSESAFERVSDFAFDKTNSPSPPEQAHKRGFFEDVGPDPTLEEESAIEPPSKANRTDENDPPSQRMIEMEKEAFSTSNRKGRKGKRSKKSKAPSRDLQEPAAGQEEATSNQPPLETDTDFLPQQMQEEGELNLAEPLVEDAYQDLAKTASKEPDAPDRETRNITDRFEMDEAWNVPAKKGKKGKKQRKGAVRMQSEPEIVEADFPLITATANGATQDIQTGEVAIPSDKPVHAEYPEKISMVENVIPDDSIERGIPRHSPIGNTEASLSIEKRPNWYKQGKGSTISGQESTLIQEERPGQASSLDVDGWNADFRTAKKGKQKGKEAQKWQQPINSQEDGAAIPPVDTIDRYGGNAVVGSSGPGPQAFEDYLQQPERIRSPSHKQKTAEDVVKMTSPLDQYGGLGPEPPNSPEKPDDYFSIPTTKDAGQSTQMQLSPPEVLLGQIQGDLGIQSHINTHLHSEEHTSTSRAVSSQEREPDISEISYGAKGVTEVPGQLHDLDQYSPKAHNQDEQLTDGEPPPTGEHIEATGSIASEKRPKTDKKSKKHDTAEGSTGLIDEKTPHEEDRAVNSTNTRSRSASPVRPPIAGDEEASAGRAPSTMEDFALAGTLGAGVAVAEGLTRKQSTRGKKGKRARRTDNEEEEGLSVPALHEPAQSFDVNQLQSPYGSEAIYPQSSVKEGRNMEDIDIQAMSSPAERSYNRDSAVHVSDSPIVSEPVAQHRAIRDSGYQDTEASPIIDLRDEEKVARTAQEVNLADPFLETANLVRGTQVKIKPGFRQENASPDALETSTGVHKASNESLEINSKRRRSQTTPTLEKELHKNLDAADIVYHDPHEPSPIDSTTKDRSSVLFQSSPSAREAAPDPSPRSPSPPHTQRPWKYEPDSSSAFSRTSSTHERQEHQQSIFGGLSRHEIGILSPPKSPITAGNTPRARLGSINEYSPEEPPLHKHGRRSLSNVESPERGSKSRRNDGSSRRRLGSPALTEQSAKAMVSTDEIISRLSWPAVDDEKGSVERERSRSRTTDRQVSDRPDAPPKRAETELRSFSGASVRSGESINAIIKEAPGSIRSSATPPLRRVDRSVSSDLREANRVSHAKKRRESSEAAPAFASSSSTVYDPTKDKGKGKAREMADVYVGNPLLLLEETND